MMKIAVCDDDRNVLDDFRELLRRGEYENRVELTCLSSAQELLTACENTVFDLIFSDIMLGEADGIAAAVQVSARQPEVRVVFITSHVLEYAEEIFTNMRPYGYIGKPVHSSKVDYYIRRLEKELEDSSKKIAIMHHGVEYSLLLADIRYLESDKRQLHIHCAGQDISIYEKLDNLQRQLDDRFVRCHQSFLVNLDWVTKLDGSSLVVRKAPGGTEDVCVSISRNHLPETRKRYFEHKARGVL